MLVLVRPIDSPASLVEHTRTIDGVQQQTQILIIREGLLSERDAAVLARVLADA